MVGGPYHICSKSDECGTEGGPYHIRSKSDEYGSEGASMRPVFPISKTLASQNFRFAPLRCPRGNPLNVSSFPNFLIGRCEGNPV